MSIPYEKEKSIKGFYVDFYIKPNKIIEVLGPVHFITEDRLLCLKTKEKIAYLKNSGYLVSTIDFYDLGRNMNEKIELFQQKLKLA